MNNKLVGFLTAHRLQRFDTRKAEVLLYEIGVLPKYQKRGIGKALLAELKKWAKEVGADEIWVLTAQSNKAAIALYTASGGSVESNNEQLFVFKI